MRQQLATAQSMDSERGRSITEANLSLLKQGKVKGVRFDTLARICEYLHCQPGDLLAWEPGIEEGVDGDDT